MGGENSIARFLCVKQFVFMLFIQVYYGLHLMKQSKFCDLAQHIVRMCSEMFENGSSRVSSIFFSATDTKALIKEKVHCSLDVPVWSNFVYHVNNR